MIENSKQEKTIIPLSPICSQIMAAVLSSKLSAHIDPHRPSTHTSIRPLVFVPPTNLKSFSTHGTTVED